MLALLVTLLACTLGTVLGTATPDLALGQGSRVTIQDCTPNMPPCPVNAAPQDLLLRADDMPTTTNVVTEFSTITSTIPSRTVTHVVTSTPTQGFITTILSATTVIAATTVETSPPPSITGSLAANDNSSNDAVGLLTRCSSVGCRICWMISLVLLALNT